MIFAFVVLSMDIGVLLLTRTQLQNAADAAALAGAITLVKTTGETAAARSDAIEIASDNRAFEHNTGGLWNTLEQVVITDADVSFPAADRVRVQTHRTEATGDPLRVPFLRVINPVSGGLSDVTADATAEYYWISGARCLRPWCPPDRWFDADGDGSFNPGPSNPDEFYDPDLTGYNAPADIGTPIVFKLNKASGDFGSEWYYAVNFPPTNKGTPVTGADQYRTWISQCADDDFTIAPGDSLQIEPGNMTGPTSQGVAALIALDPGATWDSETNDVVNSAYPVSPRITKAALFDPVSGKFKTGGRDQVKVIKIIAFFVEGVNGGGDVTGRFMQAPTQDGDEGDPGDETFLYSVRLVE